MHTQNEGVPVHSNIENLIKRSLKSIEFVSIINTAKKNPRYYLVEELSLADLYNTKSLCDHIGFFFPKLQTITL